MATVTEWGVVPIYMAVLGGGFPLHKPDVYSFYRWGFFNFLGTWNVWWSWCIDSFPIWPFLTDGKPCGCGDAVGKSWQVLRGQHWCNHWISTSIHQQFVSLRFPHGTSLRWTTRVKLRWQAKRSCFTLKIREIPTINYLLPMILPYIIMKWEKETYKFHTIRVLLMEEILQDLGCIKPCKFSDKLPINWCRISSINKM